MKTYLKSITTITLTVVLALMLRPALLSAAVYYPESVTFDPGSNIERNVGLGNASPTEITQRIIQWVLSVLALIALALVIYAGYIWLLSRGNEEEVKKARGILEAALFGLIVILASYGITSYVFENLMNATFNS